MGVTWSFLKILFTWESLQTAISIKSSVNLLQVLSQILWSCQECLCSPVYLFLFVPFVFQEMMARSVHIDPIVYHFHYKLLQGSHASLIRSKRHIYTSSYKCHSISGGAVHLARNLDNCKLPIQHTLRLHWAMKGAILGSTWLLRTN